MADLIAQLNELAGKGLGAVSEEDCPPVMEALNKLHDALENPVEISCVSTLYVPLS